MKKLNGKQEKILKGLQDLEEGLMYYAQDRQRSLGCPDVGGTSRLSNIHIVIEDIRERIAELVQ